ncbi:MAG: 4'-phosphopantetheinyl transferase superfamily protein [Erysipelotrichaceae bacterium]|nr:4'-phosphopantetheinyl transferase superfamily protein [Erysipelotrichaceae bacterium]
MIVGIGCDIVKVNRLIKKRDEIAKKVLSKEEYIIYISYDDKRKLEFLSGRFAIKEAIFKACNKFSDFSKINVYFENGKLCTNIEIFKVFVSISHEDDYAIGYCVMEDL